MATLAALALLPLAPALGGCGLLSEDTREGISIPPASAQVAADLGLGPGVRPLSFGPGDKGSPRVSPSGERVAFVLDGYVAEKSLYTRDSLHKTMQDFGIEQVEWLPDGGLAVLSPEDEPEAGGAKITPTPSSLFVTKPDGSSEVRKLIERIGAASTSPGGESIVVARVSSTAESSEQPPRSSLMLLQGSEEPARVYLRSIEGYVTGLSVSPDGSQAVLAVRRDTGDAEGRRSGWFEIHVYRFSESLPRRVARVPEGMEVLGAPQWTPQGIYFVAGEAGDPAAGGSDPTLYNLYRAVEGSDVPEPVRGVGEDFVAASISVSPDGGRLAVVGRRNPGSLTNLYVLDLASDTLEAVTANENMEIKTNPRDLAWSPDGRSVLLVARSALTGPKVYDAPAQALSSAFYNLYEVPVGESGGSEG